MRRDARVIAGGVLDGARDRGRGQMSRSVIDQQRRATSLTQQRPSRPGRTPQAIAARRNHKVAA
jgi:DNA-directed RNA polymerase specialized sigma subunit